MKILGISKPSAFIHVGVRNDSNDINSHYLTIKILGINIFKMNWFSL